MKRSGLWLGIGILLVGIGIGVSIIEFMNFSYTEIIPTEYQKIEKVYEYPIDTDNINYINIKNSDAEIVSDSSIDNIQIKVNYYDGYKYLSDVNKNGSNINVNFSNNINLKKTYIVIKDMLKNKTIFELNDLYDANVTIFVNPNDVNRIKINRIY